ncbi:hypothetical protein SAMN05421812_101423 [Asanoa hainanensis]|uniref:Uncharacterized protein n=1 Tax=Asanoa hainanensis TaxID=560556 RepID=A0A239GIG7_9ACTN|nr:hypothetical protein [Asanoa hainanensis]SNS68977.1 hypothetical protein SAMN05421812_101423 [Asanoa hainanensis]
MIMGLVHPAIVLGGLVAAIALRRRLGAAARAAIAGFAVLAGSLALGWWFDSLRWTFDGMDPDRVPGIGDLPPMLVTLSLAMAMALADAAGMALLVVAVLRGRARDPEAAGTTS